MTSDPFDRQGLLLRWQSGGDRGALEALLELEIAELRERLRREGGGLLSASASASDVVQEAVSRLLQREGRVAFEDASRLSAYLWQIAWRILIDQLRRRGHRVFVPDVTVVLERSLDETGELHGVEAEDQKAALLLTLNLLEPSEREVLELVYFEGLRLEDAGRRLGISPEAANMRLVRARRALAKKLSRWTALLQ